MSNTCTLILVGVATPVSDKIIATFHNCQISLYSQWSSKNLIVWNWLKKFMQVWIDVKFMHTNFGGCGHSDFGDIATFKNSQISLSDHGL